MVWNRKGGPAIHWQIPCWSWQTAGEATAPTVVTTATPDTATISTHPDVHIGRHQPRSTSFLDADTVVDQRDAGA
jgi:hypothetical protein